jgi:hypothetical protein
MLSGPGGGGCRLSDDGDRDGDAESSLEAGDKVRFALPLAACFLVRGIFRRFAHYDQGQDVRLSVQVSRGARTPLYCNVAWRYGPWEETARRLVTLLIRYGKGGRTALIAIRSSWYRRHPVFYNVKVQNFASGLCCAIMTEK